MLLSAIYRILCVACLLYANFQLCCATDEVVDEQTARIFCMRNCSHLTKDVYTTQLSSESGYCTDAMFKAEVVRIFCVVCPCLFALLLNCSALNSGKEQKRQIRRRCMVNCFHSGVESFRRTLADKIWNHQSCFKQCLRNFGKDNFVRKHRMRDGFGRSKRETLVMDFRPEQDNCQGNGTCFNLVSQQLYAIPPNNINITFHGHVDPRRVYANISWIPPSASANLDNYTLIYVKQSQDDKQYCCRNVSKTNTFAIVHNSTYGLFYGKGWHFYAGVLPLPHNHSDKAVEYNLKGVGVLLTTKMPAGTTGTASTTPDAVKPLLSGHLQGLPKCPINGGCTPYRGTTGTASTTPDNMSREEVFIPVVVVSILVMLALLLYWYFYHKREPKGSYYTDVSEMEFDAFIIYSTPDEKWVKTTLLPILEENNALKCCVHYRDFAIGKSFRENMAESVYKSRKTIAVVSHSFFKSKYCNHEMEIALGRLVERGDDSVIVIKLDDVDRRKLPKALKERSYIDYFKSNDKEMWAKQLIQSIKVSVKHKENWTSFV